MSLLHRIARLFKADLHGLLDALEEPDVMLKQAVREMREVIEQSETQLNTMSRESQRYAQHLQALSATLAEYDSQIDFCFAENNEAAIKTLLRKKLETRQILQATENRRQTLAEATDRLETELAERQDKLKSILDKMALFSDQSPKNDPSGFDAARANDFYQAVTPEDVELAYLQEKRRRQSKQAQREQQP
ncbi:MAG: PspA/IM30 family protein [Gammaproteobacteria bacterium]